MPWARFEDDYLGNQKLTTLSTAAIALDMASIVYSARELRDGVLTANDVQIIATLIHIRRWPPVADELVRVNRWSAHDGAYSIHDYLEYQPSREQVLTERAAAAERMRRARSGRSSPERARERSAEVREKFALPGPGPGPGPGPEHSLRERSVPPQPPASGGGAPPDGAPDGSANGVTTACCILAEVSDGRRHAKFCPNATVPA